MDLEKDIQTDGPTDKKDRQVDGFGGSMDKWMNWEKSGWMNGWGNNG